MVGAAIREPMSQTRIAVEVGGTGPQPRFEGSGRPSTDQRPFRDLLLPDFLSRTTVALLLWVARLEQHDF